MKIWMRMLPLLALSATGQVVNTARDDGSLELLLSNPVSRTGYFLGTTLVARARTGRAAAGGDAG